MFNKNGLSFLVYPVVLVAVFILAGCSPAPPPTQELSDAEAAVASAKAAGAANCAPEEFAAAESALRKGKALMEEFCHEIEARRMLVDAKTKADEAKFKCASAAVVPPPEVVIVEESAELRDIFFDFDKSNIRTDAMPVLDENASVLTNNPTYTVVIEGYADIRGTDAYNLGLAQRRANSARDYLIRMGVDSSRIEAVGKGETSKFGAGTSMQAYQLNRRAHFIPLKPGEMPGVRLIIKKTN